MNSPIHFRELCFIHTRHGRVISTDLLMHKATLKRISEKYSAEIEQAEELTQEVLSTIW